MRLANLDFALLADEASRRLAGARVQKAWSVARAACVLQLRGELGQVFLLVRAGAAHGRLSVLPERPAPRAEPPPFQALLRRLLEGAELEDARYDQERRLTLHFARGQTPLVLAAVMDGAGALAVAEDAFVRALDAPRGQAPQGLLPGRPWTAAPPRETAGTPRLLAKSVGPLPLLAAAEEAVGGAERAAAARAASKPQERRLASLARTMEKVRADAARADEAQAHRADGELLKQHLPKLRRGQREATLEEYDEEGLVRSRTLKLDPAKSPAEQVAWHFHQARRLLRGAEVAKERLAALAREEAELRRALAAAPPALAYLEAPEAPRADAPKSPASPFKEYLGHGGVRIRVGKGPRQNDVLTFKLARPSDLWLHARGAGGAHVVVSLEKGAELPQEALLDAAHLALHHSGLKGEPTGEVSYTYARFVRKPKGAAPGLVTLSKDRTFWVRIEPARLSRLLAAEV